MIRIKNNLPARLPSEYQEVEYLESTGTQYIDTGYAPYKTMTEVAFQKIGSSSATEWIAAVYNTNNNRYYAGMYRNGECIAVNRSNTWIYLSTTTDQLKHTIIYNDANNKVWFDGVSKGTVSDLTTQTSRPLFLYCMNGSSGFQEPFSGRIYYCKITDKTTNTLVRDFVPCYRKSDNEPGMYDLVNNVFYTNAGSGTFLIGNEVSKRDLNINPMIGDTPLLRRYVKDKLVYGEEPKQGRFVCVGASGKSYYSEDGETWASMSGLGSTDFNSVAYGNGRFVAINSAKGVYYSTDGKNWIATNSIRTNSPKSIAYGNGRFVIVTGYGYSYCSLDNLDGLTWTETQIINNTSLRYITFANDRFVCVGDSGKSYYSTDGITWTAMSGLSTSYNFNAVAYGNGMFVCGGNEGGRVYYSTNGTSWTYAKQIKSSGQILCMAYGNGKFVCVFEYGYTYYSTDGKNWTSGQDINTCRGITYANDRFVAVGNSGKSYYSLDGINWVEMTGLASATYNGVAFGKV